MSWIHRLDGSEEDRRVACLLIALGMLLTGCSPEDTADTAYCEQAVEYQQAHDDWTVWAAEPTGGSARAEEVAPAFAFASRRMEETAPAELRAAWDELATRRETVVTDWREAGFRTEFWVDEPYGQDPRGQSGRSLTPVMDEVVSGTYDVCGIEILDNT